MKCPTCGKTYPSKYYFHDEARTTPPICGECFASLPAEQRAVIASAAKDATDTDENQGIAGWLVLCAISLVLLPLLALYALSVISIPAARAQPSGWVVGALLYGALFCLFAVFGAARFFQRRRSGPRLIIALLLANVGFWFIAGTLWDYVVSDLPAHPNVEDFLLQQAVGSLVACFIWIPYFVTSRRVKRTFLL